MLTPPPHIVEKEKKKKKEKRSPRYAFPCLLLLFFGSSSAPLHPILNPPPPPPRSSSGGGWREEEGKDPAGRGRLSFPSFASVVLLAAACSCQQQWTMILEPQVPVLFLLKVFHDKGSSGMGF
uniref:Uncharacterized protein n=1 Tax=Oryza glumipatula TaxID=40148 RepID=A0A0E0A0L5_9ORYZ